MPVDAAVGTRGRPCLSRAIDAARLLLKVWICKLHHTNCVGDE